MEHHPLPNQTEEVSLPCATAKRQKLLKTFVRELAKTAVYLLAASAVIVFCSIAWFVSNRQVDASTASIQAGIDTIRIATKGLRQKAEEQFLNLSEGTEYRYGSETYYYTEGGQIALRLDSDETAVFPGASGKVTFYIIPGRDGTATIPIYLSIAGYDKAGAPLNDTILNALLSGHILLFRSYNSLYYSDWLDPQDCAAGQLEHTFTVELPPETRAGVPFPVTFYWVWPLRYENMEKDLFAETDEDRTDFLDFIDLQATQTTPIPGTAEYSYSRIFIKHDAALSTLETRSRAYDLADEYIGANTSFLYLSIQTDPSSNPGG